MAALLVVGISPVNAYQAPDLGSELNLCEALAFDCGADVDHLCKTSAIRCAVTLPCGGSCVTACAEGVGAVISGYKACLVVQGEVGSCPPGYVGQVVNGVPACVRDDVPPITVNPGNYTSKCSELAVGIILQCVGAWSATGRTDSRKCGLEVATDEAACYDAFGAGDGGALFAAGRVDVTVFGVSEDCEWGGSTGWNGCYTDGTSDVIQVRPGTVACTFTKARSVAWVVLRTAATSNCE